MKCKLCGKLVRKVINNKGGSEVILNMTQKQAWVSDGRGRATGYNLIGVYEAHHKTCSNRAWKVRK